MSKFCTGMGLDLGYGGDPIVPWAITLDLREMKVRQNLFGNAEDLYWFKDSVFDFVYSSHLLEDFGNTAKVLKEWWRVLKVGGNLVIVGPDEAVYRKHCEETGQAYNVDHKIDNFGLMYLKRVLMTEFMSRHGVVFEERLVDVYSFNLVAVKKG